MTNLCKKIFLLLTLSMCALFPLRAHAQDVAIKTNLAYAATTTPNLALELQTAPRSTVQLSYGINPWDGHNRRIKHWLIQPEYRYWFCQAFNGWWIGAAARGGQFNVNNVSSPLGLLRHFDKGRREEGWFAGVGVTVGYQWLLSPHWNLELGIGLGYDYLHFSQYKCGNCGELTRRAREHYVGPTDLSLSIMYLL